MPLDLHYEWFTSNLIFFSQHIEILVRRNHTPDYCLSSLILHTSWQVILSLFLCSPSSPFPGFFFILQFVSFAHSLPHSIFPSHPYTHVRVPAYHTQSVLCSLSAWHCARWSMCNCVRVQCELRSSRQPEDYNHMFWSIRSHMEAEHICPQNKELQAVHKPASSVYERLRVRGCQVNLSFSIRLG